MECESGILITRHNYDPILIGAPLREENTRGNVIVFRVLPIASSFLPIGPIVPIILGFDGSDG